MTPDKKRSFNVLIIPFMLVVILLVILVIFSLSTYSRLQNYNANETIKINNAVSIAKQQEAQIKDATFAQAEKYPFRTYQGPVEYGSLVIKYPNTWSAYVADDTNQTPYIDGYFYPNTVPDIQSPTIDFALRVQLVQDSYSNILSSLQNNVQQGLSTVAPYKAPMVPGVVGSLITGQLPNIGRTGSMVVMPLRNMTLELWTETPLFTSDFNNIILPNFTFSP